MATLSFGKAPTSQPEPQEEPAVEEKPPVQYENIDKYGVEIFVGQVVTGGNYREKAMLRRIYIDFGTDHEAYSRARFRLYEQTGEKLFLDIGDVYIKVSEIVYAEFTKRTERVVKR